MRSIINEGAAALVGSIVSSMPPPPRCGRDPDSVEHPERRMPKLAECGPYWRHLGDVALVMTMSMAMALRSQRGWTLAEPGGVMVSGTARSSQAS